MNIYVDLTKQFNEGRLRAILSSGQAVALHRLAIMSKDGDWVAREDEESLNHLLHVLDKCGARYRFGAPLDTRWLSGGWSAHFEFSRDSLRVRTDFVSRPPRISIDRLEKMWREQEDRELPFVDLVDLAELKKTNREKDYAIIGELSRRMNSVQDEIRYSRSARDLLKLHSKHPAAVNSILAERGIRQESLTDLEMLETALDAERRRLMHENERRLAGYAKAAQAWSIIWKHVEKSTAQLSLIQAHALMAREAEGVLPMHLPKGEGNE